MAIEYFTAGMIIGSAAGLDGMDIYSNVAAMLRASPEWTKSLALVANSYLGRYREVVWLIGDGRSGTTWVSSVINHHQQYREMFEPFHPKVLNRRMTFQPNTYIRPQEPHEVLQEIAAEIFSGRLTENRVDRDSRVGVYRGLLVKDIFANLFAWWVRHHFPRVKIVLLLRNPFAVALSKLRKRQWFWTTDPLDLLNQPALHEDFLRPFEPLIRAVGSRNDYVENQILIWSILNWVPLVQFPTDSLHVVFYEHMVDAPDREVTHIMRYVRPHGSNESITIPASVVNKPSRVTAADSPLRTGESPVESWKSELTPAQIDAGLAILSHFGFDAVYPLDSLPSQAELAKVRARATSASRR